VLHHLLPALCLGCGDALPARPLCSPCRGALAPPGRPPWKAGGGDADRCLRSAGAAAVIAVAAALPPDAVGAGDAVFVALRDPANDPPEGGAAV
jgi:hypothetical protein